MINTGSNNVSVLLGVGDGTFGLAVSYPLLTRAPERVEVGDFNEDGKLDLATADYGPDYTSALPPSFSETVTGHSSRPRTTAPTPIPSPSA